MNITEFRKSQIDPDSTVSFYIDTEYKFSTLFFQKDFLSMTPLGDH